MLENTMVLQNQAEMDQRTYETEKIKDLGKKLTRGYVLSNISVLLRKRTEDEIAKRFYEEFPDLEACLCLKEEQEDGCTLSCLFDKEFLELMEIPEEEAWKLAMEHVHDDTRIENFGQLMSRMFPNEVLKEAEEIAMYIVTNHSCNRGASGILDRTRMEEFARAHNTKAIMAIPSSIHEMILLPHPEYFNIDIVTRTIQTVNAETVAPKDQLGDHPYILFF